MGAGTLALRWRACLWRWRCMLAGAARHRRRVCAPHGRARARWRRLPPSRRASPDPMRTAEITIGVSPTPTRKSTPFIAPRGTSSTSIRWCLKALWNSTMKCSPCRCSPTAGPWMAQPGRLPCARASFFTMVPRSRPMMWSPASTPFARRAKPIRGMSVQRRLNPSSPPAKRSSWSRPTRAAMCFCIP